MSFASPPDTLPFDLYIDTIGANSDLRGLTQQSIQSTAKYLRIPTGSRMNPLRQQRPLEKLSSNNFR